LLLKECMVWEDKEQRALLRDVAEELLHTRISRGTFGSSEELVETVSRTKEISTTCGSTTLLPRPGHGLMVLRLLISVVSS
jgi:hypothetical protein